MPRRDGFDIEVEGLREFRRDLRRLEPEIDKQLRADIRKAVRTVAAEAAAIAPRRSGALAASYKPFVTSRGAGVASTLPYAPIIEYGGTINPRGVPIKFTRRMPVTVAAERAQARIVDRLGESVDAAARRAGWR